MGGREGRLELPLTAMERAAALEHTIPFPAATADELFSSCSFRFPTEHGGRWMKLVLAHVALPPRG